MAIHRGFFLLAFDVAELFHVASIWCHTVLIKLLICIRSLMAQYLAMTPFDKTFKLYMREQGGHKLSIRINDHVCETYLLDDDSLEQLCANWYNNREGMTMHCKGNDWFVQHKKIGHDQEYVRISVWVANACRDYRVTAQNMQELSAQWQLQRSISIRA